MEFRMSWADPLFPGRCWSDRDSPEDGQKACSHTQKGDPEIGNQMSVTDYMTHRLQFCEACIQKRPHLSLTGVYADATIHLVSKHGMPVPATPSAQKHLCFFCTYERVRSVLLVAPAPRV